MHNFVKQFSKHLVHINLYVLWFLLGLAFCVGAAGGFYGLAPGPGALAEGCGLPGPGIIWSLFAPQRLQISCAFQSVGKSFYKYYK